MYERPSTGGRAPCRCARITGIAATDVHQHLWPESLIDLLRRREHPPRLRGSVLEAGGREREIALEEHRLDARLALLDRLGIDVAVVALSPALGFERLAPAEAQELVAAYEEGILEVAEASRGRIVPLAAGRSRQGFAGTCVDAGRFADLDALSPVLDEVERSGGFLFVHPGPTAPPAGAPSWWPAVVDDTAKLQAAYATWLAEGARWPALRIVFAALAGGGPFQLERLRAAGLGGRDVLNENVFFETSSYGKRALELCLATFGVGQLLFGTDVPTLDPEPGLDAVRAFGDAVAEALCTENPTRILS